MIRSESKPIVAILLLALWFGLVAGLLDGFLRLGLQELRWVTWNASVRPISKEILWFSPLLLTAISLVLATFALVLARLVRRLPAASIAFFLFTCLLFIDLLFIPAQLRDRAVLILSLGLATVCTRWFLKNQEAMFRVVQRSVFWLAAIAVLLFAGIETGKWAKYQYDVANLPVAAKGAPNIVVIVLDTMRADHLSSYGYARQTTPNIDALARQGTLFENAFATSSWTFPSHASILTGYFPYQHGADGVVSDGYDGRYPTIAQDLRARGYRTMCISGNNISFNRYRGFGRGFVYFEDYFQNLADMAARSTLGFKFHKLVGRRLFADDHPVRRNADDVTDSALRMVAKDSKFPFFLLVNYYDVHAPYSPPQPYRGKFSTVPEPGGIINPTQGRYLPKLTPEQLQEEIDAYDGAAFYLDTHIGRLFQEMDKLGQMKNTIVVITSDHGEAFGEHGLYVHLKALYLELIRVPLLISWPGKIPAGIREDTPVSIASIPATLLELWGASSHPFPGPSLTPFWAGPKPSKWPMPLAELAHMSVQGVARFPCHHGASQSLVDAQRQYIIHEKFGEELYDWRNPARSQVNIVGLPEEQAALADFRKELSRLGSHSLYPGKKSTQSSNSVQKP